MRGRMTMSHVKMAFKSLRQAKWRSLLTVFGIVVGITAVITMVSLGEGVKRRVESQIRGVGTNVVTVSSGKLVTSNEDRFASVLNLFATSGVSTITSHDVEVLRELPDTTAVVPLNLINGVARTEDKEYESGAVIAATSDLSTIIGNQVQYGDFFGPSDNHKNVAVIGKYVAEELFGQNIPTGHLFTFRGQEFVVRGVFEEFETSPLVLQPDFNRAIVIPYGAGEGLTEGGASIFQVLVQASSAKVVPEVAEQARTELLTSHKGENDFTVLTQDDKLELVSEILDVITAMIAAVAAVSLFVGGIGIMNIMLVSVTERTHEIGLRKAVGATNRQVSIQFLIESTILGFAGGIIGVVIAVAINFLLRVLTGLQPVITWPIVAASLGLAVIVGAFFGVMPALRAAQKHPIEALRHTH